MDEVDELMELAAWRLVSKEDLSTPYLYIV